MLLILPIHSFVLVPVFVQMCSCFLMLEVQKKEVMPVGNAYALNTPLLLEESDIMILKEDIFNYDNSVFINQDDDFV